ncbi:hypothetical protein LARI1_G006558, partial [Lachnellula arida]
SAYPTQRNPTTAQAAAPAKPPSTQSISASPSARFSAASWAPSHKTLLGVLVLLYITIPMPITQGDTIAVIARCEQASARFVATNFICAT